MKAAAARSYRGVGFEGWTAKWYAANTKRDLPEFQTLGCRIAAELPSGSAVLEVAPGPGYLSIELARAGKLHVTALEISESFVRMARANAARQGVEVDFRQGDAAAMSFENATFDFVLCRAAFKKFAQPVRALQEMHRVLRPSGQALIIDLRRDVSRSLIDNYVAGMRLGPVNAFITRKIFHGLVKSAYTESQMRNFISQAGFQSASIQTSGIGFEARLHKEATGTASSQEGTSGEPVTAR